MRKPRIRLLLGRWRVSRTPDSANTTELIMWSFAYTFCRNKNRELRDASVLNGLWPEHMGTVQAKLSEMTPCQRKIWLEGDWDNVVKIN